MSASKEIEILCFGSLRKFATDGKIRIEVPVDCSVSQLRALIFEKIKQEGGNLSEQSIESIAIGNRKKILADNDKIEGSDELALLPPVCGG